MAGDRIASADALLSQMEIQKHLTEEMIQLNKMTPGQIAQYLSLKGIKAQRGCATECAISRLIVSEFAWANVAVTNLTYISAYPCAEYNVSTAIDLAPYENVAEFLIQFDSGYFPHLLEDEENL